MCVFGEDEWSVIAGGVLEAVGGCVGVVMGRGGIGEGVDMQ